MEAIDKLWEEHIVGGCAHEWAKVGPEQYRCKKCPGEKLKIIGWHPDGNKPPPSCPEHTKDPTIFREAMTTLTKEGYDIGYAEGMDLYYVKQFGRHKFTSATVIVFYTSHKDYQCAIMKAMLKKAGVEDKHFYRKDAHPLETLGVPSNMVGEERTRP